MYYRELKLITWLIMFNNAFHSIYISLPILMPDYHLFFSLFERQKSDINSMLLLLLVKLLLYIFVGKVRFPCVALVWVSYKMLPVLFFHPLSLIVERCLL